jgi:hypothetical protein
VPEHCHTRGPETVVILTEETTQRRLHSQQREETGRYDRRRPALRIACLTHSQRLSSVRRDIGEHIEIPPVHDVGIRPRRFRDRFARPQPRHQHASHFIRRIDMCRRTKEHAIEHTEHRRVRTHTECHHHNHCRRQTRCAHQATRRVRYHPAERQHPLLQPRALTAMSRKIAQLMAVLPFIAETPPCFLLRFRFRPPRLPQLLHRAFQMVRDLTRHLLRRVVRAAARPQRAADSMQVVFRFAVVHKAVLPSNVNG